MTITLLKPKDYLTTQWLGGTTTQLTIFPRESTYANRDFLWRISSATVELEESDFTSLPDYHRWISVLSGDMTLSHNCGEHITLQPYDAHEFEGSDNTHSWGKCRDFNLMLRKDKAEGIIHSVQISDGVFPFHTDRQSEAMILLYCAEGSAMVNCTNNTLHVSSGESVLIENAGSIHATIEAEVPAVFIVAEAWRI